MRPPPEGEGSGQVAQSGWLEWPPMDGGDDRVIGAPAGRIPHRTATIVAWVAPLLALGIYLVALGDHLPAILDQLTWDSDSDGAMVLAHVITTMPAHGHINIATQPGFLPIVFNIATSGLPAYRAIWEALPVALLAVTVAAIALSVWLVSRSVWATTISAAIAAGAGPLLSRDELSQTNHVTSQAITAVLGLCLVLLVRRQRRRPLVVWMVVAIPVLGFFAASDGLAMVCGAAALAVAGVATAIAGRELPRRILFAGACCGIAAGALAFLEVFSTVASRLGYSLNPAYSLVPALQLTSDDIRRHLALLPAAVLRVGDGALHSSGSAPLVWGMRLNAVFMVASVIIVAAATLLILLRCLRRGIETPAAPYVALFVFWGTGIWMMLAAWTVGNVAIDDGSYGSYRYLSTLRDAVAVGVPLLVWALVRHWRPWRAGRPPIALSPWAGTAARLGIAACVTVLVLTSAQRNVDAADQRAVFQPAHTLDLPAAVAVLDKLHLTHGYGPYFDALAISYRSDFHVSMAPIYQANGCPDTYYCGGSNNSADGWYREHVAGPTFVLLDPDFGNPSIFPPTLGPPDAVYTVGRFTIGVFDSDVATRFYSPAAG